VYKHVGVISNICCNLSEYEKCICVDYLNTLIVYDRCTETLGHSVYGYTIAGFLKMSANLRMFAVASEMMDPLSDYR
jgi:hypothetical protein